MQIRNSSRLFCILARKSSSAIVFRRGPSKHIQLLSWDRKTDLFVGGQWLKGRIYERRADLSPTGKYLVYFAANHKPPHYSWTAISKPPCLTALAMWAHGSTWGGGGLFKSEFNVLLNGACRESDENKLPNNFKISSMSLEQEGLNVEGFGIYRSRLMRDGWDFHEKSIYGFICSKEFNGFKLEMHETTGVVDGQSGFEETIYRLIGKESKEILFEKLDWADFDQNGDFLAAKEGSIFRIEKRKLDTECDINESKLICDLKPNKFEEIAPPPGYMNWNK